MNICLLTRYSNFRGTGITRIATELMKGLRKRSYRYETLSCKGNSLYSYFFFSLLEIPLKLPRKNTDIFHAVTSPIEGIWLPEDRSVVTYCDALPILYPERFGSGMGHNKLKNLIGRKYAEFSWKRTRRASLVTCISSSIKEDLMEYFEVPEEKIRVIRMGIREDLESEEKKDTTFRLGYLGQLDRRKRVDLLIRSFKKSKLDGELVIGGLGLDSSILKELAEDDRRIKFLGLVPDNLLASFYNSLDVLIFPTWAEGYGLPPVEAMACKRPTVVLRDAIIPPEVKDRCIIVENLDEVLEHKGYLDALCRGLDYESNYKFAKEHSWDGYVEECIKYYKEVLDNEG